MKKESLIKSIAIFTFLFAMGFFTQAQTSFSCTTRTTCLLDEYGEIDNCSEKSESSLFVFNEAVTMITHTTESNKTVYYINDNEYDEEDNSFTFDVTSENGNDYTFYVFPDDNYIAAHFVDKDDNTWVIVFKIKKIF